MPTILGGAFPLLATPKGLEKGHSFNGMTRWIKTVIHDSILVHDTVLQHSKSTCVVMARDRLVKVCSSRGEQIHLVLMSGSSLKKGVCPISTKRYYVAGLLVIQISTGYIHAHTVVCPFYKAIPSTKVQ